MLMALHCTARHRAVLAAVATLLLGRGDALDNGLAKTPQMGYNSWYDLMGTLTEDSIRETADAMVSLGLVELGYNYLNLDDCWAGPRDNATGRLTADKNWRGGTLKSVADYVHSKGMKFGTCALQHPAPLCDGRRTESVRLPSHCCLLKLPQAELSPP